MTVATPDGNGTAGEPLLWSLSSATTPIARWRFRASQRPALHYARVIGRHGFAV
jgi:hypothetical protein